MIPIPVERENHHPRINQGVESLAAPLIHGQRIQWYPSGFQ